MSRDDLRRPPPPRERPLVAETFAPIELDPKVTRHLRRVEYEGASPLAGRVHQITDWEKWSMERRIAFLRAFVEDTSRDPAIVEKANEIIRSAGVQLRDHRAEWAALLKWVQQNIRFMAESKERIQSPQYTLTQKMGDCDDLALTLAALGYSMRLPFKFVLSGRDKRGERVRWVEGSGKPPVAAWTHIYVQAQWPPFRPTASAWAEPTLDVPLGWDSVSGGQVRGRADLGEGEAPPATTKQTLQQLVQRLPWVTIGGSVVGSVLSAVVVSMIVRPAFEGKRLRRSRRLS